MKHIIIKSKQELLNISKKQNKTILITINGSDEKGINNFAKSRFDAVLELTFDELEFDPFITKNKTNYGTLNEVEYRNQMSFKLHHVLKIHEFLKKNQSKQLVIQCKTGLTKAPSIALGLCALYYKSKSLLNATIYARPKIKPMGIVLRKYYGLYESDSKCITESQIYETLYRIKLKKGVF